MNDKQRVVKKPTRCSGGCPFGNDPLAGRPKRLTISRCALNSVENQRMSDNRCRYGTGENRPIILHKKIQMRMGEVEREGNVLYETK